MTQKKFQMHNSGNKFVNASKMQTKFTDATRMHKYLQKGQRHEKIHESKWQHDANVQIDDEINKICWHNDDAEKFADSTTLTQMSECAKIKEKNGHEDARREGLLKKMPSHSTQREGKGTCS